MANSAELAEMGETAKMILQSIGRTCSLAEIDLSKKEKEKEKEKEEKTTMSRNKGAPAELFAPKKLSVS